MRKLSRKKTVLMLIEIHVKLHVVEDEYLRRFATSARKKKSLSGSRKHVNVTGPSQPSKSDERSVIIGEKCPEA